MGSVVISGILINFALWETNNETKLVIYKMPNGETHVDVTILGDTIWHTQHQIAELFGTKVPAISKHLKNTFESGELEWDATISKNTSSMK